MEGEGWRDIVLRLLYPSLFNTLTYASAAPGAHSLDWAPPNEIRAFLLLWNQTRLWILCLPSTLLPLSSYKDHVFSQLEVRVGLWRWEKCSTKSVLYDGISLQIFPYRKGIYTWAKHFEWKEDDGFVQGSSVHVSLALSAPVMRGGLGETECRTRREMC